MPEQKWTPKMVAERLEEAARTLRVLRVTGLKPLGYGSTWPDVVHDPNEAFGWNATEIRLGPPTPESITRMDEALNWLRWLEPDQMRLVWLHAEGVPRKVITNNLGVSRVTAWRLWMSALMIITSRLGRIGNNRILSTH
ncbi:MAG: hypothetical protein HQL95_09090 [Magnetococcales bacterium]|nr:hypothetical protein [Magnetococcales bacterium]